MSYRFWPILADNFRRRQRWFPSSSSSNASSASPRRRQRLAEAEIASEIYSTAGDYDLLVKFYVDNNTDIGPFRQREGAGQFRASQDTHTIITFQGVRQRLGSRHRTPICQNLTGAFGAVVRLEY